MSSNTFANHLLAVSASQKKVASLEPYLKLSGTANNTPATVATYLTSGHDVCGLVPLSQSKVLVVHNFMYDSTSPLRPHATGNVFALTGRGRSPNIVGFALSDLLAKPAPTTGYAVPTMETLVAAASAAAFKDAEPDEDLKLVVRPLLPVPPLVGYVCLHADTQDPAELAMLVMKALQDFDSQLTPRMAPADAADGWVDPDFEEAQDDDGDTIWVPRVTAVDTLGVIAQFLWGVHQGSVAPVASHYLVPDRVDEWATGIAQRCLTGGGMPGTPGAPPQVAGTSDAVMTNLANKIDDLVTLRSKSDSEKKGLGIKAFDEMTPRTQEMILFCSGTILAVTEHGETVETPRTRPVESYVELLNTTTSARAHSHVNENLTLIHKCPVNIPLSTVVAMTSGRFLRVNATRPGAWSAFCCFPFHSSATAEADDSEAIALHLKSTEGKGLSETDVSRSTKIVHSAPIDTDELGYFITGFGHLTKLSFGDSSLPYRAIADWAIHLKDHIQTYKDCQHSDPKFVTRVLARIDHGIQQFLRACAIPESRGTAAKYLEFENDRMMIERMMFAYPTLPDNIVTILDQRLTAGRGGRVPTPRDTDGGSTGEAGAVINLAPRSTMATRDTQLMRFMTSSANNDGPLWGNVGRPCPHFFSTGVCPRGSTCAWAPSHNHHATGRDEQDYIQWMARCRQKILDRSRGDGAGRGRGRGGRGGRGGGAGRGTPAPRAHTPSPHASESGSPRKSTKVQFDDDATTSRDQG